MKLGETSLLELPYHLMKKFFPHVKKYYTADRPPPDFYEHFWTGFILTALVSTFMHLSAWAGLALLPIMFVYIVVKEVIMDAKKRSSDPYSWLIFKVDMTMRIAGFVFGSPLLLIPFVK